MKGFVSIKDLVMKADKEFRFIYKSLAEEIDTNGIYEIDLVRKPNSREVQNALSSLATIYMLEHEGKTPSVDYSSVEAASKQAQYFGWPTQKVPDFSDSSDPGWIKNFTSFDWQQESIVSVDPPYSTWSMIPRRRIVYFEELNTLSRILLTGKASTAAIACEIEANGVFGFGVGGRTEHYSLGTGEECEDILVGLTEFSKVLRGGNPSFEMLRESIFTQYGWPPGLQPSFSMGSDVHVLVKSVPDRGVCPRDDEKSVDVVSNDPVSMVPQTVSSQKSKRNWSTTPETYEKVICGLLLLIQGRFGHKHPQYDNDTGVRETLDDYSNEAPGLKKDGLKKLFADALKHKYDFGVDPDEVDKIIDSAYEKRDVFGRK